MPGRSKRQQRRDRQRRRNDAQTVVSKRNFQNIQSAGLINKPYRTQEGFLVVDVVIAKAGPLEYKYEMPDGTTVVRNEMLTADAIFDPEFKKSCNGASFVLNHPQNSEGQFVDVSTENYEDFLKGVLIDPREDRVNERLLGTLKIFDGDVRELAETEELTEVSQGYTCNIINRPGVYNGTKYDVEQVNLRLNHLALVNEGRSGEDVRILFNSKTSVKIQEFLTRKEVDMKVEKATQKRNEADTAKKTAEEKRKEAIQATLEAAEAIKRNETDTSTEEKKDVENECVIEKKNTDGNILNEVAQMLVKAAEMLQGAAGGSEETPVVNEDGEEVKVKVPEKADEEIKEPILNSAKVNQMVVDNFTETQATFATGASILGVEETQAVFNKLNSVDKFRRYCLIKEGDKSADEVARMNSYQVQAYFEALADSHKARINAPVQTEGFADNNDEAVSLSDISNS
jgi:hypothetical protein